MEIILKEGEEIRIRAKEGTSESYRDIVCFRKCILSKSGAKAIGEDLT